MQARCGGFDQPSAPKTDGLWIDAGGLLPDDHFEARSTDERGLSQSPEPPAALARDDPVPSGKPTGQAKAHPVINLLLRRCEHSREGERAEP